MRKITLSFVTLTALASVNLNASAQLYRNKNETLSAHAHGNTLPFSMQKESKRAGVLMIMCEHG